MKKNFITHKKNFKKVNKIFIIMPIGDNIKRIRILRKLKVAELADKTGIKSESIYAWERNDYNPSEENLQKIAKVLEVPVKDFYSDVDHTPVDKADDNTIKKDPEVELRILRQIVIRMGETNDYLLKRLKELGG